MRIRRRPGVLKELKKLPGFLLPGEQWQWEKANPLYVELGMGKGKFITSLAYQKPEINFVGIEKVPEIIYQAGKRVPAGLPNLRFLLSDVTQIDEYFQPGEISRIYLNFSDPWPKNRHAHRRLTSPFFLKLYRDLLVLGGAIHFKTDCVDFFEYSLRQFSQIGFSVEKITYDLHNSGYKANILTEYELKFMAQGVPICRCEAIKMEGKS
ncbi:MAG TPA: tRNA (guanosine(46)-N7)-methyltransferase TrmB [Clostridia bacterium]|nr:tRNA (guanosine(46)-N7)-methyltransferase TrmB [Clostridia bacterium]